jgi:hypothetical protein
VVPPALIKGDRGLSGITRMKSTSTSGVPDSEGEPYIATIFRFKRNDPSSGSRQALSMRSAAEDAVLMENKAVALVGGYLVVYSGARSEDDPGLGPYELVPATDVTTDILDLLKKGKLIQKSRKRPGLLVAWDADHGAGQGQAPGELPGLPAQAQAQALTLWSGADDRARRQVLSDVRDLADLVGHGGHGGQTGRGLPLNANAPSAGPGHLLQGKFSHLSLDDRHRLVGMLQEGTVSPDGMLHVLEAAGEVADGLVSMDSTGGGDSQVVLDEFLGPNGYLDLSSPGVASVMTLAASRGADVQIQLPDHPGTQGTQGIPSADVALLISAGLGLKRALPWAQVKGAIIQASISDAPDPVRAVSEDLGTSSLRTSMAPVKRFVESARYMGMSASDVSAALDVAAATAARDMGGVIAAIPEKDKTRRHTKWRAAGVPQTMLQPLDRIRSSALRHVSTLSPAGTPAGTPGTSSHRARERAEEMLGTLLAEGMTISEELCSVPIETYSAHPFTVGAARTVGADAGTAAGTAGAAPGVGREDSRNRRRPARQGSPTGAGEVAGVGVNSAMPTAPPPAASRSAAAEVERTQEPGGSEENNEHNET